MPTTYEATEYLQENGVIFAPGKAANAGGVATSALEMSQNSERLSWTFEEVDAKLKNIMVNICHNMVDAAKRYDMEGNYVAGANIAGFEKVPDLRGFLFLHNRNFISCYAKSLRQNQYFMFKRFFTY